MKTFKNLKAFEKRLYRGMCWEDYILVGGKTFKLYEYGGGSMMHLDYDYIYFLHKKTNTLIYIKYDCPGYKWENHIKVKTKDYRFISIELIEGAYLWR